MYWLLTLIMLSLGWPVPVAEAALVARQKTYPVVIVGVRTASPQVAVFASYLRANTFIRNCGTTDVQLLAVSAPTIVEARRLALRYGKPYPRSRRVIRSTPSRRPPGKKPATYNANGIRRYPTRGSVPKRHY